MSQLQDQFLTAFQDKTNFTTKEAYKWYCQIKRNPEVLPQRSQLFQLIIYPLIHNGKIIKIDYGTYCVIERLIPPEPEEEDEFDKYIKAKIKGGDKK